MSDHRSKMYTFRFFQAFSILLAITILFSSCSSKPETAISSVQEQADTSPAGVTTEVAATMAATTTPSPSPTATITPTIALPIASGTQLPTPSGVLQPGTTDFPVQLARWGKGALYGIFFSPDRKTLAVTSGTGVYLYDAHTLEEATREKLTDFPASRILYSPDGKLIAMASSDWAVHVFSLAEKRFLFTVGNPEMETSILGGRNLPEYFAFSPDSKTLWFCSNLQGQYLKQYDMADGREIKSIRMEGSGSGVALFLTQDGSRLVFMDNNNLLILDTASENELLKISTGNGSTYAISPDHSLLIISADKIIYVVDCVEGKTLGRINNNEFHIDPSYNSVLQIKINPTNQTAALIFSSGDLCIWTEEKQTSQGCLPVDEYERFSGMDFSPDGSFLFTYSNKRVSRWETNEWTRLNERQINRSIEKLLALDGSFGYLTMEVDDSTRQNVVSLWPVEEKASAVLDAGAPVKDVIYTRDGKGLISLSSEKTTYWNMLDRKATGSVEGEAQVAAVSYDGKDLAVVFNDGSIQVFALPDLTLLVQSTGRPGVIKSIQFSSDNTQLLVSSEMEVAVWNVADGQPVSTIKLDKPLLGVLPSGKNAITLDTSLTAILWDLNSGKEMDRSSSLAGTEKSPLAIVSAGQKIALLGAESFKMIRVGNYGDVQWNYDMPGEKPSRLKMSSDGLNAVVGNENGVQVFNTDNYGPLGKINQQAESLDISISKELAIAQGNKISIWSLYGSTQTSITGFVSPYNLPHLAWVTKDNELLESKEAALAETFLFSGADSVYTAYDPLTGKTAASVKLNKQMIMASSPDHTVILFASTDYSSPDDVLQLVVAGKRTSESAPTPAATDTAQRKMDAPGKDFYNWNAVSFSNNGVTAAALSGASKNLVALWSVDNGKMVGKINQKSETLAISPDGTLMATDLYDQKTYDHLLIVYDISNPVKPVEVARVNQDELLSDWNYATSMVFSSDGKWLAMGSTYGSISLVDTQTWKKQAILTGHVDAVSGLVYSGDDSLLYSTGRDGTIRVWGMSDRPDMRPTATPTQLPTPTAPAARDGKPAFSLSQSDLEILEESNLNRLAELNRWQVGGRSDYGGCSNCVFYLWNVPNSTEPQLFLSVSAQKMETRTLSLFSPKGVAPKSMTWSVAPNWAALSPDGKTIAGAVLQSPTISLYTETGKKIKNLNGHTLSDGNNVAFTPDGRFLASVTTHPKESGQNEIIIWDMQKNGTLAAKTRINDGYIRCIAFEADGDGNHQLWVGLVDEPAGPALRRFKVSSDSQLSEMEGVGGFTKPGVVALAFSPDGQYLAVALDDGSWRVVKSDTLQELVGFPPEEAVFEGKNSPAVLLAIAFLPNGSGIVTSHYDGTVRLWGVKHQ